MFRQLAASLETQGHPGPYLRHIKAENERIAAKYKAKHGKEMASYLPKYMTDEYIDQLCKQWDDLAPKLKLEKLAKESGRLMQLAIDGENGKGTSLITVFNSHQNLVYDDMVSGNKRTVGFEDLKQKLMKIADGKEAEVLAETESKLSAREREDYKILVSKSKFTKADFPALERFYDGPHDRLSEYGKSLLTARINAGQKGEGVPTSDAEKYSAAMKQEFETLFGKLRNQLTPDLADKLIGFVEDIFEEIFILGQVEYEIAIKEWALE